MKVKLKKPDVRMLDINSIKQKEMNANTMPRKEFEAVVDDIAKNGLDFPILVRPVKGGYEIVDGEHRYKACKQLNLPEVPCIVRDLSDKEARVLSIRRNNERGTWDYGKYMEWIEDVLDGVKAGEYEDVLKSLAITEEELREVEAAAMVKSEVLEKVAREGKEADDENEDDVFVMIRFSVSQSQLEVINAALDRASEMIEGMANIRGNALEAICHEFLNSSPMRKTAKTEEAISEKKKKKHSVGRNV